MKTEYGSFIHIDTVKPGQTPKHCRLPACFNFFMPEYRNDEYCSKACRADAANARAKRRAEKQKGAGVTKRQIEILRKMRDEDLEITCSHGETWLKHERISPATMIAFHRMMVLRSTHSERGRYECYRIGETGLEILRKNRV